MSPDTDGTGGLSRRTYLSLTAALVGTMGLSTDAGRRAVAQTGADEDEVFHGVAVIAGLESERDRIDLGLDDQGTEKNLIYEAVDTGNRYVALANRDDPDWQSVGQIQQRVITSSDDLPAPTNGTHTLEDSTAYLFNGFVTSPYGLELGASTPLVGRHGSVDGFICTGGGPAISGTNAGLFARDVYVHAPGGTLFDLTGDQTTEMLVESCSFSDAAGIASIADLGTIDGFRVPSFKGCNFEDFAAGLTFDGSPDKIFLSGCPMRGVTTSGVSILTFASTLDVDIVDMPDNYVKGVQSDTEVIRVETGGSPTDVFQYRGTVHDGSVTTSNILTGEAAVDAVGYRVVNAYPLRESAVIGELSLDSPTTTTISAQDTYTQIDGATSLGNESARVTQVSNGVLQYDGKKDSNVKVTASCTVEAPSNETFAIAIAKNGTVEPTSEARGEGSGNAPAFVAPSGVEDLQTGDTLSLHIKNIDSASDITVDVYNLNFSGL